MLKMIKRIINKCLSLIKHNVNQSEIIHVTKELQRRKEVELESNIKSSLPLPLISYKLENDLEERFLTVPRTFSEMEIVLDPYQKAPLCAIALFKTKKLCKARFIVIGDYEEDHVTGEVSDEKTCHRLPIFGLYPDRNNQVKIQLLDKNNFLLEERVVFIQTNPLPKKLEDVVTVEKNTIKSAYGLILISGKKLPFPLAFDSHGVIRYFLNFKPKGYGIIPLTGGRYIFFERNFLYPTYQLPYSTHVYEIDLWGRIHKVFYVPKGCHHDICEKEPGGNLFTISNSNNGHIGDLVIEMDRKTGEIIKQLDFRQIFGKTHRDNINWVHLNTVVYNNKEDSILVCARNLHSICKICWKKSKLIWILCDPRFWKGTKFESKLLKPVGDVKWFYQPHAPYMITKNQLVVFDNHWHTRRPVKFFDEDMSSYIKIYKIDEKKRTVSMEHSYQSVKSKITSNARVEMEKKRVFSMGAYLEPKWQGREGMIYEFDYDTEKILNQYSILYSYYRGYEFLPQYDTLAGRMQFDENFISGFLIKPNQIKEKISIPVNLLSEVKFESKEEVTFKRIHECIYIGTKDHLLRRVYFVGRSYTYYSDLREPAQTDTRFKNIVFSIAFPLHMMKTDRYQIIIDFKGNLYNTEKYIQIEG